MSVDRKDSSRNLTNRLIWIIGGAFVVAAILSAYLVFSTIKGLAASWNSGGLPSFAGGQVSQDPEQTLQPGETPDPQIIEEEARPWDGSQRVTILLMGLDYRDWEQDEGPPRTDSMMLVTIDPVARTAGMLSIPRDLWVEIPGFEHNRINTAYFLGESYNLPGGGPGLAMDTVENVLGVPIDYYAVIYFHTFEDIIDEIGGIDVLVQEDIKISPIGRTSLVLTAKAHHLNGAEALAYARARKSEGGDFDRSQRQQQVALAIRDRILGVDMLPSLIRRAPELYNIASSGLRTNLTFDQMLRLGILALEIPQENIDKGIIGPPDMVEFETLPTGAQVLRPLPDKIRLLRDDIFTEASAITPAIQADSPSQAAQLENARVAVLNGAGIEGIATTTADYLQEQGLNVVEIANANRLDYAKSIIIDYTGNPYTTRYLSELMGLSESQILSQPTPDNDVDVEVVLGADWTVPSQ
ncbi:MAG: LCP family protein [Anaerolineales bacterium]